MRVRCYKDVALRTFYFLSAFTAFPECFPRSLAPLSRHPYGMTPSSSLWLNISPLATDYA